MKSLRSIVSLLFLVGSNCHALTAAECAKLLKQSEIVQAEISDVQAVKERFHLIFETTSKDVYPQGRLQVRFAQPFKEIDRECLDRHVPLLFVDGYKFPQLPLRYLPADKSSTHRTPPANESSRGGESVAVAKKDDDGASKAGDGAQVDIKSLQFVGLEFDLDNIDATKEIWLRLHNRPRPNRDVTVGLGFMVAAEDVPAGVEITRAKLKESMRAGIAPFGAYSDAWIALAVCLGIGVVAALILLQLKESFLRFKLNDRSKSAILSPGTTQAYIWSVLIIGMTVHLWVLSGSMPKISPTLIGLMGLSGGTMAVAMALNIRRQPDDKVQLDVPELQMWAFNLTVMLSFVLDSHQFLKLADIEPTWAGVLAVSNGVYIAATKPKQVL